MTLKCKLRRGHKKIFGTDSAFTQREAADLLEAYLYRNKFMIDMRRNPYKKMTEELADSIHRRREECLGDYIEVIDPNYIINIPWAREGNTALPRRHDDPNYVNITAAGIKKWGNFVPIIVGALPEWHPYWKRPTKYIKKYDPRCSTIIEGRHRTYTIITLGLSAIQAFILDPVEV